MTLTERPEWFIYDSSKLDQYIACPRQYFYRHVLGWEPDTPAHDLHFGSSWHKGREHQLIHGYDDVAGAYQAFLTEYRKVFGPETDNLYNPKTPTAALAGFMKFAAEKKIDLIENHLVILDGKPMTEIGGTVPINFSGRRMHYRMDSIMEVIETNKKFSWDHKSTSGKWIHDSRWDNEYYLSIQNGTYTHCLYCMFPIDEVLGVEFDKVGFEFLPRGGSARSAGYHVTIRRVQAFKTPEQMNVWLWNVNDIIDDIERDMDRLSHCKEGDPVMTAFQQKPKSCTAFKGCPYLDFCMAWANPLQRADRPPIGYKVDFWDPSRVETTNKLELDWREI